MNRKKEEGKEEEKGEENGEKKKEEKEEEKEEWFRPKCPPPYVLPKMLSS